jgi:hypothetical protein
MAPRERRQAFGAGGENDFRRSEAFQLGVKGGFSFDLSRGKIAGGEISGGQAERFAGSIDRGQEIIPFRGA